MFLVNLKETEHFRQHDIYHGEICQQSGSRGWRADGTIDRREEKDGGTAPSDAAKVCMGAGKMSLKIDDKKSERENSKPRLTF